MYRHYMWGHVHFMSNNIIMLRPDTKFVTMKAVLFQMAKDCLWGGTLDGAEIVLMRAITYYDQS